MHFALKLSPPLLLLPFVFVSLIFYYVMTFLHFLHFPLFVLLFYCGFFIPLWHFCTYICLGNICHLGTPYAISTNTFLFFCRIKTSINMVRLINFYKIIETRLKPCSPNHHRKAPFCYQVISKLL